MLQEQDTQNSKANLVQDKLLGCLIIIIICDSCGVTIKISGLWISSIMNKPR